MGKTNMYRPETLVLKVSSTVPAAATTNVDFTGLKLPAGTYRMALTVKSSVTGTTTAFAITPFADDSASQLGNLPFRLYELDDIAGVTSIAVPAGAAGRYVRIGGIVGASDPSDMTVTAPHGVRVVITKGGAETGEVLEASLTASRIS